MTQETEKPKPGGISHVKDTPQKVSVVHANALEATERASIDMQIETAKKFPMHLPVMLSQVKENMLTLATMDEETAAACFYSLPRGGKVIQGPSVRLAEIALNCYGNIRVGTRIIDVDSQSRNPHVVIQAVCHDLENNVLLTIEKRRRIVKKRTKQFIDEDDINLAVNACTSIAYRDAAFKLIPMAIIKPVWQKAKLTAVGDVRTLNDKKAEVIEKLKKMGATEEKILGVVGCRKVEDIGVEQLGQLIGIGTSLKDGEITFEDAFPPAPVPEDEKPGAEGLRRRLAKKKNGNQTNGNQTNGIDPEQKDPETQKKLDDAKQKLKEAEEKEKNEGKTEDKQPLKYYCKSCDHEFNEPKKGGLCPKCLSDNIIDQTKKKKEKDKPEDKK